MKQTDESTVKRSGGVTLLDQYYTDAHIERQTYDLMIPAGLSGSAGLILCIHGGAWIGGDKDGYTENLKQACEEMGVAAAAINYRYISETVHFDDLLDDITAALAAIKREGSARGVCFDRALLTGGSAGGHLSLLYAYARKDVAPIRPVCVVELCGPADLEDDFYYAEASDVARDVGVEFLRDLLSHGVGTPVAPKVIEAARPVLKRFSPVNYVDRDTVPTVFGHGEQDGVVPYRNALDLDAKLTACGVEHTFVSFPHSGHGCEDKASMKTVMDLFFRCVDRYLK